MKALTTARVPFTLLLVLMSPVFGFFDGSGSRSAFAVYVAIVMVICALATPAVEMAHLFRVMRPYLFCAAIPALWMVVQSLPMPIRGLEHPIWRSAESALGRQVWGAVSADPGATVVLLTRYLAAMGATIAVAASSIDRRHAERIQSCLGVVTALFAAVVIFGNAFAFDLHELNASWSFSAIGAIGILVNAAMVVRTIERNETRRDRADDSALRVDVDMALGALGVVICATSLLFAPVALVSCAGCGILVFAVVVSVRRLQLEAWMTLTFAAAAILLAVTFLVMNWGGSPVDPTLRFADSTGALISVSQRMLVDWLWTGTGAGTFGTLLPIYHQINDVDIGGGVPTTAAAIAIELGRPMLWVVMAGSIFSVLLLLKGARHRVRDSFYSISAAACFVVVVLKMYCDASLLRTETIIVIAAIMGLGIAQSTSPLSR
jgi:hypothetical protein